MKFILAAILSLGTSMASGASVDDLLSSETRGLTPEHLEIIRGDFEFLAKIKGTISTKLNDQLFGTSGSLDGSKYIDFYNTRVSNIGLSTRHHESVVGVYVTGYMWFTPAYFKSSAVLRASVLMHESAHAIFGSHATCPTPFLDENGQHVLLKNKTKLEGKSACANRIEDAYVYQTLFLTNIAKYCETCDTETKAEARRLADLIYTRMSRSIKLVLQQDQ